MAMVSEAILYYVNLVGFGLHFDYELDSRVSVQCMPLNKSCMSDAHRRSIFSALLRTSLVIPTLRSFAVRHCHSHSAR